MLEELKSSLVIPGILSVMTLGMSMMQEWSVDSSDGVVPHQLLIRLHMGRERDQSFWIIWVALVMKVLSLIAAISVSFMKTVSTVKMPVLFAIKGQNIYNFFNLHSYSLRWIVCVCLNLLYIYITYYSNKTHKYTYLYHWGTLGEIPKALFQIKRVYYLHAALQFEIHIMWTTLKLKKMNMKPLIGCTNDTKY